MTGRSPHSEHRVHEADVARLPFFAGVVLIICGLDTLVQGLYTISYWQGWLFLVLGIIVAATGAMLLFKVPGATVAALVAASASLIISAVWVATYHWFNIAAIGLDLVAIYALARTTWRSWTGRDPLRT